MDSKTVRVRFAPSPTGPLHMGGVRTALYNYLFAKKHNGQFILRVEDTDQTRFVSGAEQYIIDSLKWCGINPDEGQGVGGEFGPYKQSKRKDAGIYNKYVEQLLADGYAYYAFDSSEELDQVRVLAKQAGSANWQYNYVTRSSMRNSLTISGAEVEKLLAAGTPYVVRIKLPRNEDIKFEDIVRGWVKVNTNNMDDKVLFKSDGMPTYHMANIVDDHLMQISHVIRGEEWLPSAPLHILLYRYLGWEDTMPKFAHLPLLLKPDGNGKLSKRDGDRLGFPVFPLEWNNPENGDVFSGYKEMGYFPEAFVNMLAFLGWNPGTEQEIFSLAELTEAFSLEKVNKAGARYDHDKTQWFNQQYLRLLSNDELGKSLQEQAKKHDISLDLARATSIASLLKDRAHLLKDLWEASTIFFFPPATYDEKTVKKKWNNDSRGYLQDLRAIFFSLEQFSIETIENAFKTYLSDKELGFGKVGPAFRLAVTGAGMGPSMFEICAILGKEETIMRIDTALDKLPQ
jgi:glutamyl-tRNA synthetase